MKTAGLVAVAPVTEAYDENVPAHFVISWDPKGTELPKGSSVNLVVSKGPAPRQVPEISGSFADAKAALTFKLSHDDLSHYNAVQKVLYAGVILCGILIVLSGLSIWKPVQFQELTALFGGYDFARYVHFVAMSAIVGFLCVHVALALLVPKSLRAMIAGK